MDNTNLFTKIRDAVSKIPRGKVSTYGEVAKFVGSKDARKVGWAVYGNQDSKVPCHRVVAKDGSLAEKFSLGGWQEQRQRLENDGIEFSEEKKVDLEKYGFTFN
jgi:methylated-DNA-protein-cysteine methyltransferase-like protein